MIRNNKVSGQDVWVVLLDGCKVALIDKYSCNGTYRSGKKVTSKVYLSLGDNIGLAGPDENRIKHIL